MLGTIQHHRTWMPAAIVAALASVALITLTGQARAQFADCAASGYLGGVDDRMGAVALACDEAVRFTIETPGGTREVRIIYSTRDLAPGLLTFVSDIRRGVDRSAAALRAIGEGDTADITIWASEMAGPDEDVSGETRPIGGAGGECVIALYPGSETAYVTAHEFFHCVQFATAGDKTYRASSTWWVEGSAEWFATHAFPGQGNSDGYVSEFDGNSASTALTAMSYGSLVFFFWLDQNFGPSMVMALIAAMPASGGGSAQQDALAGLLSAEDFQRFAENYLDREIRQPGGRAIPSSPFPGDIYVWSESREHTLRADRFVLARFQMEIACGDWSVERRDENGTWKVSRDDGPWEDLAERLTVAGPDPDLYRVAAFGTETDGFRVTVEANRNPCQQCTSASLDDAVAACLIGSWQLTSGGYGEQIQRVLEETGFYESIQFPDLESVLVINPDGTFEFPGPPEDYNADVRTDDGDLFVGIGTLSIASGGQWSVDGDILHMCQNPGRVEIDLTIIDPEGDRGRLQTEGGPDSGIIQRSRTFACSAGSLTLVEDIPFTPTVTWHYSGTE